MSATVRIYDLARELKQEPKRIIEDLQREGADVSVPSNSVAKELADKIRNKYFPQVETSPKRGIKIIKKKIVKANVAATENETEETPAQEMIPAAVVERLQEKAAEKAQEIANKAEEKAVEQEESKTGKTVTKLVRKPVKAEPEPEPEKEEIKAKPAKTEEEAEEDKSKPQIRKLSKKAVIEEEAEPVKEIEEAKAESDEESAEVKKVAKEAEEKETASTGKQVKKLTLTKDAKEKGFKTGERVVSETKREQTKLGVTGGSKREDRKKKSRRELAGTPGENAKPQTVYIPPTDNRRRPGMRPGRRGGKFGGRSGRYSDSETEAPKTLSIEERILAQVGKGEVKATTKQARLTEGATVREFAEALGVTPRDIVQLLVKRGIFATLNQSISEDVAVELGETFGYEVSFVPFEDMVIEQEFEELIAADSDDVEFERPPVVTVMGHVDHGKTSLLDAIRSDNVAEGEAGGITQHIGAYSVFVDNPEIEGEQRRVVFFDTPGHEAFTMMRARGAKSTDVVILVVAADDGVMPQTIEAIEHSRAAKVPMIVAINKIDKPGSNADKVKQELAAQGVQPVDWGGDVEMIEVSAKQRTNLDVLLETVLLQADIMELKASPTRRASGVVLEAKLDRGRGSVATVLVQQGTLRVGDSFIVGQYHGRVRALFSDRGEQIEEAPPATPVEVLGLQGVPQAGDTFQAVSDIDKAQTIAGQRQQQARQIAMLKSSRRGIESLGLAEIKELLIILKADVQGSVEVLRATLEKLSTEKVKVRVIRSGVGAITESDVLLASATQADVAQTAVVIIGFNVRPGARAVEVAKQEDVDIRLHSIIYKIEEEITAAMIGMLDAIEKEIILGKALVQETFKVSKIGMIAGCRVTDGVIRRQASARLIRDGVVIWDGDIASLKRFKEDTNEVKTGFECGISLVNFNDLKVDDEIEAFIIEKTAATEL